MFLTFYKLYNSKRKVMLMSTTTSSSWASPVLASTCMSSCTGLSLDILNSTRLLSLLLVLMYTTSTLTSNLNWLFLSNMDSLYSLSMMVEPLLSRRLRLTEKLRDRMLQLDNNGLMLLISSLIRLGRSGIS